MTTSMSLPEYLRFVAERIEQAEKNLQAAEALRLIEVMREELAAQVKKRVEMLPEVPVP